MDQFVAQLEDADSQDVDAFANALGRFFDGRFIAWVEKQLDEQAQPEKARRTVAEADDEDHADDEHDADDETRRGPQRGRRRRGRGASRNRDE